MSVRRSALLVLLPLFAVAGAWLGARGNDTRDEHRDLFGRYAPTGVEGQSIEGRLGDDDERPPSSADWLLPYALQPDDLPEAFRARLHTEAFVTSEYPGVEGEVEAVFSMVFGDDPFVAAAFENLADPGSASASDIEPATAYVLVYVLRAEDTAAARMIFEEIVSPIDEPQTVLLGFEGDGVELTEEDLERTWVTRVGESEPVSGLGDEAARYVRSVAQLDYDTVADVYRSDAELRRDTTEAYVVVLGRYVLVTSRAVVGFDSELPRDIDMLTVTRAVVARLEAAPR